MLFENIAAISTPIGVGGVAIIRISGETPLNIAKSMFKPLSKTDVYDFEPNKLYLGEIDCGGFSDFGYCVYFAAPKSYTGENMVEFHCHGGIAVTEGVLNRALSAGARMAEHGEFTRRAFLNGKCSLASSEGLISIINSESAAEVKAGYYLYKEKLTNRIKSLQSTLTNVLAEIDASIDFPDEVEQADTNKVRSRFEEVEKELNRLIATYNDGEKLKHGVRVAIIGKPNTGKSSLLNALLNYDKAIVSAEAGTTRDIVEGSIDIDGIRFNFSDTAGIRESDGDIEKIGIEKSKREILESDLILVVFDGEKGIDTDDEELLKLAENKPKLTVLNKIDVATNVDKVCSVNISAKTGEGIDELKKLLKKTVFQSELNLSGEVISEKRHYEALKNAVSAIKSAEQNLEKVPLDLITVDIKDCWSELGKISGETASETVINEIFSRFCVGK